MKNRIISRANSISKLKNALNQRFPRFNLSEFIQAHSFIVKGIFWGVAAVGLILGMINFKTANDYKRMYNESIMSIATEVSDRVINDYLETADLTAAQEEIIRNLISDRLSTIDYSSVEEILREEILDVKNGSSSDMNAINDRLTALIAEQIAIAIGDITADTADRDQVITNNIEQIKEALLREIESRYSQLEKESASSKSELISQITNTQTELTNQIITNKTELQGNLDSNYEALMAKITETNGHISDPGNSAYFQYGFDETSGAAGYYLNNEFKPF